ncbi:hypothetical protein ACKKBG_A29205 [Auxenochlorella protothecoides x Auxenochlorella symbiontica]
MLGRPVLDCRGCQEWAQERWRRIRLEFTVELPLLKARWKQILFGALFQYFHGISTQLAHRMHRPQQEPLHDLGFEYLPEVGLKGAWMSETIFWCLFIPFVLWSFSPFVTARKRFYTAVLYARLLMVLTACQALRILSFTVTQLPAPNYHCRADQATAVLAWPRHWWQHVVVDVGRQATHGCGDLLFSSHTTFVLVGCLTFTEYGSRVVMKVVGWIGVGIMGLCIIASRKHYTVDVVVAWYVVPLVFYAMHRRWTTKRPLQDYWPHRPLVGEEGVEILGVQMLTVKEGSEGKPLLPVTTSTHGRSGSMHAGTHGLRNGDSRLGPAGRSPSPSEERGRGGALIAAPQGSGGLSDATGPAPGDVESQGIRRNASSTHVRTRSDAGAREESPVARRATVAPAPSQGGMCQIA